VKIDLTGKVALVTGSAHRVGKAIALALADEGVNIVVHYHKSESDVVRDTMQDIKTKGVDAISIQSNLSDPNDIPLLMDALKEHYGKLDILVNSASVFPTRNFMDISVDEWDLAMNVNLRAPFLLTQHAARLMQENEIPGGAIVNICDQGAFAPWPKRPHHGISKYGLWMLTQVSALALAPGIRVNAVVPGPVMKAKMNDAEWQKLGEELPLRTTGQAEDVGRAVVYLVSEDFLTGTKLEVNGGEHLLYPSHAGDYD
jgi:NAD(P)-dependent dehydrogenase (short-subunit alcohol dehydrogenase family)